MTIEGDSSDYDLLSAHAEQLAKRFKGKLIFHLWKNIIMAVNFIMITNIMF
jgi:hypothetical protein